MQWSYLIHLPQTVPVSIIDPSLTTTSLVGKFWLGLKPGLGHNEIYMDYHSIITAFSQDIMNQHLKCFSMHALAITNVVLSPNNYRYRIFSADCVGL